MAFHTAISSIAAWDATSAAAFAAIWFWLRRRSLPPGEMFVWYVAAYGIFRFLVEFVRGNEVVWNGLTRPQLFLAVTIPLVLLRIALRARSGAYRPDRHSVFLTLEL